jgi:hypothetical protein
VGSVENVGAIDFPIFIPVTLCFRQFMGSPSDVDLFGFCNLLVRLILPVVSNGDSKYASCVRWGVAELGLCYTGAGMELDGALEHTADGFSLHQ